jgi:hypothetical protein
MEYFEGVVSRSYRCKTQQRGDDAVVDILSSPGVRGAEFRHYRRQRGRLGD